ncbi:MAG TPA: methylenetetrahydrofolate reductase [NAD(P)H], partial [Alphaproteobacteria bacterium]|nr:methylenetetrahydrofolate reductase [NAD(P)H] [Alphaproteobacteria bacterium]
MSGAGVKSLRKLGHKDRAALAVSFEFFPPKTEKMLERLWRSVDRLAPLRP